MAKKKQLAKLTKDVTKTKNRTLSNHTKNILFIYINVLIISFLLKPLFYSFKKKSYNIWKGNHPFHKGISICTIIESPAFHYSLFI